MDESKIERSSSIINIEYLSATIELSENNIRLINNLLNWTDGRCIHLPVTNSCYTIAYSVVIQESSSNIIDLFVIHT